MFKIFKSKSMLTVITGLVLLMALTDALFSQGVREED